MRPYKTYKNRLRLRTVVRDFGEKWSADGGIWYMAKLNNKDFEAQLMTMYNINHGMANKVRWIVRGGIERNFRSKEIFGFDQLTA